MREGVPAVGEIVAQAAQIILDRSVLNGQAAQRRPRGRGSQLSGVMQVAIIAAGTVFGVSIREIAKRLGMHRKTVRRVLSTRIAQKFKEEAHEYAIGEILFP